MPRFNRDRAKSELGWSDAKIDAYLASPQAQQDAGALAQPVAAPPAAPQGPSGGDPLGAVAGMASSALDAIGGPRTLIATGVTGLALKGLQRAVQGARTPAAAPAAPQAAAPQPIAPAAPQPVQAPSEPKPNASLVTLDAEDVAGHPEFRNYREGQQVSRKLYERVKSPELFPQPGSAAGRARASAPADATARPSVSMSTMQEAATVPNSVTISKGRAKPALKVVEGTAPGSAANRASGATPASPSTLSEAPMTGSAAGRAAFTRGTAADPADISSEGLKRHNVQIFDSETRKHVPIEDLSTGDVVKHAEDITGRLSRLRGGDKMAPVMKEQLQALAKELDYRDTLKPFSRYPDGYASESKGKVSIENMHIGHMKNAFNKLARKIGSLAPGDESLHGLVKQFQAMKDELKFRYIRDGDLNMFESPRAAGSAASRAEAEAAMGPSGTALRQKMRGLLKPGGGKAALGGLAALLGMSMLSGRAQAAGVDEDTMNELSQGLPDMFDNPDAAGALAGMRLARQHGRPTPF